MTKGIVQVPEGRRIFARLTVTENLRMGAYVVKDKAAIADGSSARTRCSRGSRSARARWPGRSPAASSRCWPWAGR